MELDPDGTWTLIWVIGALVVLALYILFKPGR